MRRFITLSIVLVLLQQNQASSDDTESADRGYRLLTETAFLPSDFDQATFDEVWRSWPEPLRSEAEKSSLEERRAMAFDRYGLTDSTR